MAKMTDTELLAIVQDEMRRSIGLDFDSQLIGEREQALNYIKGDMPDLPSLKNRSSAVSTDVSDAIETIKPDLLEILAGSEDVVSFNPVGPEDEEAAQQETDYIRHVFFNENNGWLLLQNFIDDALKLKLGVFKTCWEEDPARTETFKGKSVQEFAVAMQNAERMGATVEGGPVIIETEQGQGIDPDQLVDFRVIYPKTGKAKVYVVPPEDFTAARDATLEISKATYSAMRWRPRAQDLIADGIPEDVVNTLPAWGTFQDNPVSVARDTAGENEQATSGGTGPLRIVEAVEHYLRLDIDGGKEPKLWRILTGANSDNFIEKEEAPRNPFAVATPYIVPHRLYGESVADRLIQIQQINTVLLRMTLDDGYFAMNQRVEVNVQQANEWTIPDLLRNEPGLPIRSKGNALNPISSGGLNFDTMQAMEYVSTMAEKRTGIVRNAQGLNPDTLHDTAKGAMALMNASQKRVRMVARVLAETGIKQMFLNLHALIRENATGAAKVRLNNEWVDIDPTSWGERNDMTIEVGLGSAGREHDLMAIQTIMPAFEGIIAQQGGFNGPIVTAENVYAMTERMMDKLGFKGVNKYITDPKTAQPQEPKPDPAMMEAQAKLQMQQQEGQAKLQLQAQEGQQKNALAAEQAARDHDLAVMKVQGELQLKRETTEAELAMKRELLAAEIQMKQQVAVLNAQVAAQTGMAKVAASTSVSEVEPGGEPG